MICKMVRIILGTRRSSWIDQNSPRYKDIAEQISELDYSDDSVPSNTSTVVTRLTQLMHIFYTNFNMIETARST